MADAPGAVRARVFVVLNPQSGSGMAGEVRQALAQHFTDGEEACHLHELTDGEDVVEVVRRAISQGAELIVAGGGDGTVSAVADAVVGTSVPLGIIPLGTANVLARELGIPVDLEGAFRLLAGPHAAVAIDAMRVGDRVYLTQVGVGLDALMIRDTGREQKRRFGRLAYLRTVLSHLIGFQPARFSIAVDDRHIRQGASQVVIANCGLLGQPPFRWGPNIRPDDGRLDVCIVRARTLLHYLVLGWHVLWGQHRRSPSVRYLTAERAVALSADRTLPVQADGEIIGQTPLQVHLVPGALRIIVPLVEAAGAGP
ncbi:MAG TPA: diacylglycerol kinase family protein [Isosphaeraceae bacterium]|jgi:YegS/Rv2252/BmrU family lipid kinase|nr:diacylglycerol kinase family protein [Isosphaeraceae bacterium]